MRGDQTFGDFFKAKAIFEAGLESAVDAFMADPTTYRVAIGDGYTVDPHAAVSANPFALAMLANPEAKPGSKRSAAQCRRRSWWRGR